MLTTSEAARVLGVHPNTVRRWADKGILPASRLGTRGDRRFSQHWIKNYIDPHGYNSWLQTVEAEVNKTMEVIK